MRLTIKLKLGVAFAAVIVLSMITAWVGIANLASLSETLDRVVQGPTQRVILSQELSEQLLAIVRAEKNLNLSDTGDQAAGFAAELDRLRPDFVARLESAEATASAEGRPLWDTVRGLWRQYAPIEDKIIDAVRRDARPEARALSMGPAHQIITDARVALQKVVDLNRQRLKDAETDARHEYQNAHTKTSTDFSYGVSLLPGYKVNDRSLIYFRLGYVRARFKEKEKESLLNAPNGTPFLQLTFDRYANGFSYGFGFEEAVYRRLSLRAEFTHTSYQSFWNTYTSFVSSTTAKLQPSNNQFTLALIWHIW